MTVAYSIKDLENLSGIKAHTLRIWEKRYGIIKPDRTESNIRYYKDEDLQKILNISILNRHGIKISRIACMSVEDIRSKVVEFTNVEDSLVEHLDAMMLSVIELDESKLNILLDHQINTFGFEVTVNNVLYPLLDKLSMMWLSGSVKGVHENFLLGIIKRKIMVEIDHLSKGDTDHGFRCLLFLPENETHELSLLFLNYLFVKKGARVINLGSGLSLIDVLEGNLIFKPTYICTLFNDSFTEKPLQPYITELAKNAEGTRIIITGYQVSLQNLSLPENVIALASFPEVSEFISNVTH